MNATLNGLLRPGLRHLVAALLAAVWTLAPAQALAQAPKRPFRIGMVAVVPAWGTWPVHHALVQGMRDQGLVEGRDYVIEYRSTDGDPDRQAPLIDELLRLPIDAFLVSVCGEPFETIRRRTQTVPIVVLTCNEDLVATKTVKSMNRPGGNITGQIKLSPELSAKRLEILREVLPSMRRVVVLWNPAYSPFTQDWHALRVAAQKLGITVESVEFRRGSELDGAMAAVERLHPDALMAFSDVSTYVFAKQIAERTAAAHLPSIFTFREVPDAGALMSYGPNLNGMWRHGASYFVRIMRGASPGELPIELPTRFELVINQKAARALGIKVPDTVLLRADDVIE